MLGGDGGGGGLNPKGKASDERETPQEFFDVWNRRFTFTLDVACTAANAKCEKYLAYFDE